ncbi:hypothetical protein POTOM_056879 [Populus tomentosa]|uniref:Uncharacterized protein n=1 Tax=Populus tomentosa TaxID=118781 RepID=A0A8X7XS70_POPTO|nr:hypothetical protein POTOM_056879 [Populus tomentosa]
MVSGNQKSTIRGHSLRVLQDAQVPDSFSPMISCAGKLYEAQRCWEHIFDAISNEKHLIYITGCSVEEFKKDGLMATHDDEETEEHFNGSKVHCFLCPRNPDDGRSIVQGCQVST